MKICIDLTALSFHITGIERYALCMAEEMLKNDNDNEYLLLFRNEIYERFQKYIDCERVRTLILKGDSKIFFNQIILPLHLWKIKADVFLFFAFPNPILFWKKRIYTTIHDLGCYDAAEAMSFLQKLYFRVSYRIAAKVSEKIFTVSEFSKGRINVLLGVKKDRIVVTYNGIPETLQAAANIDYEQVKEKYHLPEKYILNVSTLEPRKNLSLLLETYTDVADQVDYDLVLIGRTGWKIEELLSKYRNSERIHITGFVEDSDLAAIYKQALCFVFPSKYEGFGMPPVEALSFGCPVISSNAACMPEILGEQAEYFNSDDKEQLVELLLGLQHLDLNLPTSLNEYQEKNFKYEVSARIILKELQGV